jgi:hypothetical protein
VATVDRAKHAAGRRNLSMRQWLVNLEPATAFTLRSRALLLFVAAGVVEMVETFAAYHGLVELFLPGAAALLWVGAWNVHDRCVRGTSIGLVLRRRRDSRGGSR